MRLDSSSDILKERTSEIELRIILDANVYPCRSVIKQSSSGVSHHTWNFLTPGNQPSQDRCMQGNETREPERDKNFSRRVNFGQRVAPSSLKDMTNDKDTLDMLRRRSFEPATESGTKKEKNTYFWPVFSPSPWISSCRLVDSSRRPPWAQKQQQHYLHLTSIVSLDTFAHAHRPFNLTPSLGPKNFPMYSSSSLFCPIVSPLDHLSLPLLLFLLLLRSPHHLTFPPSPLAIPLPSSPSSPRHPTHPPHSAPASTFLDFFSTPVTSTTGFSPTSFGHGETWWGQGRFIIIEMHQNYSY